MSSLSPVFDATVN